MFLKSKLYQFGKYTWSQIDYLVSVEGYIPVANGTELNALRNAVSQPMGVGSRWAGTYTTGLDKKYIQVNHIDLNGLNWVGIATFTGVYDGNGCNIDNLYISSSSERTGLFSIIETPAVVKNLVVNGAYIRGTSSSNFLGVIARASVGTTVYNCVVNGGTFSSRTGRNGLGSLLGYSRATVSNCKALNILVECDGVGTYNYVGGFAGVIALSNTDNCYVTGVVNDPVGSTVKGTGGFVGYIGTAVAPVIINCYVNVEVNGNYHVGGFVGWNRGDGVFTNCYSAGLVTGNSSLGGFCGTNAHIITNCYYDTETSGRSDTGKGLPRTTAQMLNGTASSYINPDGSIDVAEDPDNAMFTTWDDDIWNFRTNLKYPKIRKI